jgi:signal transduction histidine kinase
VTHRLGLRARLTILVTLVFAVTISITSIVVLNTVENNLVDDTRASAETVLVGYLDSIYGGTATVGVVGSGDTTRFFYLDANGDEITEQQYFSTIATGLDAEIGTILADEGLLAGGLVASDVLVGPIDPTITPLGIDPDTGVLLHPSGGSVTFVTGPLPVGEPQGVDISDDAVGVAQTLAFADGATLQVGVSSPLQPVTDSLDTIRRLLWIAVPALVAAIAIVTWLAATRALAPVHAISSRARAITADNIDERVPVPDADDEVSELATTMNEMLGRLESSQRRQRQFVADASHELRSPVAASRAQLEVAAANPDTTDWQTTASTVLAEQEQLSRLIDDLLALSRIDESGSEATEDVDLDELIVAEAARPHPTPVRTSVSEPVRVRGDRALLTRAIRNLCDNAARHAQSRVVITLRREGDQAVVDLDDDGRGIPSDQDERIFDRFTRIDDARDRTSGGAGLGLAIAREVARAHHGDIEVTESPLGGARFTLTLPTGAAAQ